MFGDVKVTPQNESTPFNPRSVYGISKLAAFHLARNYRDHHKLFVVAGILYNHESPRRGHQFVTRKISATVAKIHLGLADRLEVGNVNAIRDWGYAKDYVVAMHAMLQQASPEDFVISTGLLHTVKDFLVEAFSVVGLEYEKYTHTNRENFRPGETVALCGDSSKARNLLNWTPTISFKKLVHEMVTADIARLKEMQK
jgi:GDPmannose 4,6-dehydratase